jgi:murein hydrolase activator
MSAQPPPAVLVDPDDMLAAIRTSMLLGALLPEMRQEVASLVADLGDLSNARAAVAAEKGWLADALAGLADQRKGLQADIDARQAAEDKARQSLAAETNRAYDLAKQASDIKDLISRMEKVAAAAGPVPPTSGPASIRFGRRKGGLPWPVAGSLMKIFGDANEFGSVEKGDSFAAVPGAVVSAPADATVAYSGPYRTYGQLLILNAGEGYYLVMAGMDRINVEVGQSVAAGEPVALMGDGTTKTAATIAVGAVQPVLYVEFRKDGTIIDPGPWWAKPDMEKARG